MSEAVDIGKSDRTPAKHSLMDRLIGQEIGGAGANRAILRSIFIDLTAGDGVPNDPGTGFLNPVWERNCSPGLLALHARNAKKPTDLVFYEIKIEHYVRLIGQLTDNLYRLGYVRVDHDRWMFGDKVDLCVFNADGATVDLDPLYIGRHTPASAQN